jgi:hypothetical protein
MQLNHYCTELAAENSSFCAVHAESRKNKSAIGALPYAQMHEYRIPDGQCCAFAKRTRSRCKATNTHKQKMDPEQPFFFYCGDHHFQRKLYEDEVERLQTQEALEKSNEEDNDNEEFDEEDDEEHGDIAALVNEEEPAIRSLVFVQCAGRCTFTSERCSVVKLFDGDIAFSDSPVWFCGCHNPAALILLDGNQQNSPQDDVDCTECIEVVKEDKELCTSSDVTPSKQEGDVNIHQRRRPISPSKSCHVFCLRLFISLCR